MSGPLEARGAVRPGLDRPAGATSSALWFGLAGLLLLFAGLAADTFRTLRNVDDAGRGLRMETRRRDGQLDRLRADIYRSSTVLRDHLLEPDDRRAMAQKAELEHLRGQISEDLRSYEQEMPPTEKEAVRQLRLRVESYWAAMQPALSWNAPERRAAGGRFLVDTVIPLRTEMVELTRQITRLNERDLDAAEERVRAVQTHFRNRMAATSAGALVLGLLVGGATIRRVRRLEAETAARFEEVEEARLELQNLSARLESAQEEERKRIACELHDEVGQGMSAMLVELGRAEAAPDGASRAERLASARRMAESSVGMVRNLALKLRPSMLDDLGLVAALRWQGREMARRHGLAVKMITDDVTDELPESYRTCLYRGVQEALHNCAKHAHAGQARVVVQQDSEGVSVTVQDDGVGFDPREEKGMGLLGMEERVRRLGGEFSIASSPGGGTVLAIRLPLPAGKPAESEKRG